MTYYTKVATLNISHVGKQQNNLFLSISMCHVTNLEYLQFFNLICENKTITKEIQTILSQCFVNKQKYILKLMQLQKFFLYIKQMLKNILTLCYIKNSQSQKYIKSK
jgi:hypothetical protein